ncbi:hypothetical protein EHF33_15260 [Deinococcus psychrotolerans]|uniref:Uncharacterized protein n=1 Tax=Deinococcus psychrotolerans TaxID=2489213 RepID=A0A3G8YFY1_9DEIO|nr:hypothetical protein [Deinococcus psychrotolerans]AZI44249.1 hypothetical protein EHF33_15260 [Deinococcus psychrotolerans]
MSQPLYRHGDVFLQAVQLPNTRSLRPTGHLTLALGEVTGHSHRLSAPDSAVLYASSGPDQYLHVQSAQATLIHEEHAPIDLPQGWYRVWQQREYIPGSVRTVLD